MSVMNWTLHLLNAQRTRRLTAALAIAGAGAAFAAGVLWAEPTEVDPSLPASASTEFRTATNAFGRSQGAAVVPAAVGERVSATARSDRAPVEPIAGPAGTQPSVPGDPSLPAADEALNAVASDSTEAAPTF